MSKEGSWKQLQTDVNTLDFQQRGEMMKGKMAVKRERAEELLGYTEERKEDGES